MIAVIFIAMLPPAILAQEEKSGKPVFPGWYTDPEGIIFENKFWIYPTYSAPYNKQVFMDAFSSSDLVTWEKHPRIIDTSAVKWAKRVMWLHPSLNTIINTFSSSAPMIFKVTKNTEELVLL